MSRKIRALILVVVLIVSFCAASGCLGYSFTNRTYCNGTILLEIQNSRPPTDALLQVTIWRLDGFSQSLIMKKVVYLHLPQGRTTVPIEAPLPPGSYRTFLQLFHEDDRLGGAIWEFVVS
ncbi:MAG: hypothetical protein ACXQTN_02510 [Methanoculleaceae archaeon]